MGQEIFCSAFTQQDFWRFQNRLRAETAELADWFRVERFTATQGVAGFEIVRSRILQHPAWR